LQIANFGFELRLIARVALVGRGLPATSKEDRTYQKGYEMSRRSET
jgi:hypothetical protein